MTFGGKTLLFSLGGYLKVYHKVKPRIRTNYIQKVTFFSAIWAKKSYKNRYINSSFKNSPALVPGLGTKSMWKPEMKAVFSLKLLIGRQKNLWPRDITQSSSAY